MRWGSYILHVVLGITGATILCWFVALVLGMTRVPRADAYVLAPTFAVPLLVGLWWEHLQLSDLKTGLAGGYGFP